MLLRRFLQLARHLRAFPALVGIAFCFFACQTVTPVAYDLSEPGWNVQRGQAVWKPSAGGDEVAGELLVATHPNGRAVVEFSKPPISFVTVVIRNGAWSISSPMRGKFSGPGAPPPGILWMQLPHLIGDGKISTRWTLTRDSESWRLVHETSGETLAGFLAP